MVSGVVELVPRSLRTVLGRLPFGVRTAANGNMLHRPSAARAQRIADGAVPEEDSLLDIGP